LAKMLPSYSFRIGSYFGSGSQIYSWIHIDDIVSVFGFMIDNNVEKGLVINAVAPHPVSNKEMAKAINSAGNFAAIVMPAPSFAMKIVLGEMSAVVLDSTHVDSSRLIGLGFNFKWPRIEEALSDILKNGK